MTESNQEPGANESLMTWKELRTDGRSRAAPPPPPLRSSGGGGGGSATPRSLRTVYTMSSLLVILVWGGVAIFLGSESGPKQSVKLLQNMVYNTTQYPPPPHSPAVHNVYLLWEGGGGGLGQREGRGATVEKLGRKYQP
jgi:hypothetical protein